MHEAVAFSRRLGLPPVATTRASFLRPADYQAHRLLRAIAENTTLSRLRADQCCAPSHWLMPETVLARYFPHVPEALTNTRRIAEQCYTDWNFKETIFPSFRQLSAGAAFETLREKTYEGARWRYGHVSEVVTQRIEKELTVIREKGYADYFLVVDEIVRQAPRTCGRGSAAASIVSYCLGITHVDPIRHNLLFERFLNPGRHDPPDIDIDFPWDERPKILEWVFAHYGTPSGGDGGQSEHPGDSCGPARDCEGVRDSCRRDRQGPHLAPATSRLRGRRAWDDGANLGGSGMSDPSSQNPVAGDSRAGPSSSRDTSGIWVCTLAAWCWSRMRFVAMCRWKSPPPACR